MRSVPCRCVSKVTPADAEMLLVDCRRCDHMACPHKLQVPRGTTALWCSSRSEARCLSSRLRFWIWQRTHNYYIGRRWRMVNVTRWVVWFSRLCSSLGQNCYRMRGGNCRIWELFIWWITQSLTLTLTFSSAHRPFGAKKQVYPLKYYIYYADKVNEAVNTIEMLA